MNDYLRAASKRYEKIVEKEYLINPISSIDCEIVTEIREILKKLGGENVAEILKEYKGIKDEEIRDSLLQFNIDFKKEKPKSADDLEEENKDYSIPPLVLIGNIAIGAQNFYGYETFEEVNEEYEYVYGIKINPTPEGVKNLPLYANYKIVYEDEENRKEVLERLISFIKKNGREIENLNKDE
jgi:hypothetical protein